MAYSTEERCAALIPNILNSALTFAGAASTIRPNPAALTSFQSSGCSLIEAKIKSMRFTPRTGTVLDDFLADIEANYVAYRAELARGSPRSAAGERTRSQHFKRAYEDGLKELEKMDLGYLGFSALSGDGWYVGGISQAEKDSVASDSDRVDPRFHRGKFDGDIDTTSACA